MAVELREITAETLRGVLDLAVAPEQEPYVASNARSIAQGHFDPHAWFRAVYADGEPVGFVMVWRDSEQRVFYAWRFMIDARRQRKGYGRAAMQLLVEEARRDGVSEIRLSYRPGDHSPREFYVSVGFEDTGEIEHGENVMRLSIS